MYSHTYKSQEKETTRGDWEIKKKWADLSPGSSVVPDFCEMFKNYYEVLHYRARKMAEKKAIVFLEDGEQKELSLTYEDLYKRALEYAAGLQARGIKKGDRLILMLPVDLNFFACFCGCLVLGAVPAPVYPPTSWHKLEHYLQTLTSLVADSEARLLITFSQAKMFVGSVLQNAPLIEDILTLDQIKGEAEKFKKNEVGLDDLAFLQYTSGSTSTPKGVMVSYRNIFQNMRYLGKAMGVSWEAERFCIWLPIYHDMGLFSSIYSCPLYGWTCYIMSPLHFLSKPVRWLRMITRYQGTYSAAPNFAFDLCTRKIKDDELNGIDLSSLKWMFNASEPVRKKTVDDFMARFAPYGFDSKVLWPIYGLAENTVAASCHRTHQEPVSVTVESASVEPGNEVKISDPGPHTVDYMSLGLTLENHHLYIVDEKGAVLPELTVGEIVLGGPSLTRGYYYLKSFPESDLIWAPGIDKPLFRTGDFGFLYNKELYITGRKKDLIIVGGRNYYPQDLEALVENCSNIRRGCCAAFSTEDARGTEGLVIVAEGTHKSVAEKEATIEKVKSCIADAIGIRVEAVELIPPRTIPKTTSGKIQRRRCRELYLKGELPTTDKVSLLKKGQFLIRSEVDNALFKVRKHLGPKRAEIDLNKDINDGSDKWNTAFRVFTDCLAVITGKPVHLEKVTLNKTLSELGIDSLQKVELLTELESKLGGKDIESKLMAANTVGEVVAIIYKEADFSETGVVLTLKDMLLSEKRESVTDWAEEKRASEFLQKLNFSFLKLFRTLSKLVWNLEVDGLENLPKRGPFIICPNHQCHLDVFFVASHLPQELFKSITTFGKKEHREKLFTRVTSSMVNAVYIDREGNFLEAMRRGAYGLERGEILFIHPEGTRSPDGQVLPFKPGPAVLSTLRNVPIVPVAIKGAFDFFPKHKTLPSFFDWTRRRRYQVRVKIGQPIIPKQWGSLNNQVVAELTTELRNRVLALLSELESNQ